ncbi:MAG TPA: DUF4190 domain-containing protein [Micromonosporaceae bacterium]
MTTTPETPAPAAPEGAGVPVPPGAGAPTTPEQGTSGLAIAGLILAILVAPIGFILSLIAVFTTGGDRKKGRGLAVAGLIISLLLMAGSVAFFMTVGKNVSTLADPGCTKGKSVILNAPTASNDATELKKQLQDQIDGLTAAAAQAKSDNVRTAMKTLADDYGQIVKAMDANSDMPPGLQDKITKDANAIDDLCTIGGAQK